MPVTEVFIVAGFHVPVMPLFDVVGSAGASAFWQKEFTKLKAGDTGRVMVNFKVKVSVQPFAFAII